jgi:hypothetical protein
MKWVEHFLQNKNATTKCRPWRLGVCKSKKEHLQYILMLRLFDHVLCVVSTYAKLITAGQDRDASERERVRGAAVAAELRRIIAPFFLRREKRDVLRQQGSEEETTEAGTGLLRYGL